WATRPGRRAGAIRATPETPTRLATAVAPSRAACNKVADGRTCGTVPHMRAIEAELLAGRELYREVVLDKLAHARESVCIATANVKDMQIERGGKFASVTALFSELAGRGVELRILHAELPSRPFR